MIRVHEHELDELKQYREDNYDDEPALGAVIRELVAEMEKQE